MKTVMTAIIATALAGTAQAHNGHGLDGLLAHGAIHQTELGIIAFASVAIALSWVLHRARRG